MHGYEHLSAEQIDHLKSLAKDTGLGTVIDALIHKYTESWRTYAPEYPERREHLYRMVLACEGLRTEITSISSDDLIAAFNNRSRTNGTKLGR